MKHFFDCGSNIGQTFDWFAMQPRDYSDHVIWCFEPSPRHFAKLIERAKQESSRYQINLCPFGLSDKSGVILFHEKDDPKGDSFYPYLETDHKTRNIENGYNVFAASKSLPETIIGLTQPKDEIVLDIDCEGCEYGLLQSLLLRMDAMERVRRIIVEFHKISETGGDKETSERARLIRAFDAFGCPLEIR